MKNVLFVQPSLDGLGGVEQVVPIVARGLDEKGINVFTLCFYGVIPEEQGFWKDTHSIREEGTRSIFHKFSKIFLRAYYVASFSKKHDIDIVVASTDGASIISLIAKLLFNRRLSVIPYLHQSFTTINSSYVFLAKILYRHALRIITVSVGLQEELQRMFPYSTCLTVYNAAPEDTQSGSISEEHQKVFDNLEGKEIFITASRMEYIKGVDLLINGLVAYFHEYPSSNLAFVFLGDGSLLQSIKKKAQKNKLDDKVFLLGRVDDIYPYLKYARGYISLARSESFGVSLVQSLRSGVPVIASDCDFGPREILTGHTQAFGNYPLVSDCGILIDNSENKEEQYTNFKRAIDYLLRNDLERTKLVARGSFFSKNRSVEEFLKILQPLL